MRGDILVVHRWMFMKLTAFLVNMINNIWLWKNPYEQWLYSSGAPWKIDNWGKHISYINVLHLFLQFVNTNIWICAPLPNYRSSAVTDLKSIDSLGRLLLSDGFFASFFRESNMATSAYEVETLEALLGKYEFLLFCCPNLSKNSQVLSSLAWYHRFVSSKIPRFCNFQSPRFVFHNPDADMQ